jgi:hypothetical protein
MPETRRRILTTMAGALAGMLAPLPACAQWRPGPPQPVESPNAPKNQNVPAGLDGADIPVEQPGKIGINPLAWAEMKDQAQQLLQMTFDFVGEINHTNLNATLPLTLIKQARQIEKMAKHIQERMR